MAALEQGAAEELIVFEDLDLEILRVRDAESPETIRTLYQRPSDPRPRPRW